MSALSAQAGATGSGGEVFYDLLREHLETILALIDGPRARAEVSRRVGGDKALDRLVRHGLLTVEGEHVRAAHAVYEQARQEGMMSFLESYVLPSLTATLDGEQPATLDTRFLAVTPSRIPALRAAALHELLPTLAGIADEPLCGEASHLSVLVIGTSRVDADVHGDAGEEALTHLKHASLQRATPAERELAAVSQFHCMADEARRAKCLAAVQDFWRRLAGEVAPSPAEASYHLTIATHWRRATPADAMDPKWTAQ